MEVIKLTNLALRFLLELAALAAFGVWGFHIGKGGAVQWFLGVGAPMILAVVWGTFGSPGAPYPVKGLFRTLLEFLLFTAAAAAIFFSLNYKVAGIYAILSVCNLFLLYFWKQ